MAVEGVYRRTDRNISTTRVRGAVRGRSSTGPGEAAFAPVAGASARFGDPSTPRGQCMRGGRWLAAVAAVGSISTGVAIAGSGKSETTPVMGTFKIQVVGTPKERHCDAKHVRTKARFEGDQISADSRLTGQLEIKATSVVNTNNGYGYSKGTFVLRRTYSPGASFRGKFVAVLEPDGGGEGFLTGESQGKHPVHLLANFNFDKTSHRHFSGEFGTDTQMDSPYSEEDQDPAILTDACFDKHGHAHGHGHGHGGGHH